MTLNDKAHRQQMTWGVVGAVAAIFGLLVSHKLAFTSPHGKGVGFSHYALHFMSYNKLGAIVGIALSAIGIAAGVLRQRFLSWVAAGGFAVVAVQTLIQWHVGTKSNIFGSDGATLAFALAMVLLYAVTACVTSLATSGDTKK